jgi:hypothetical protein
MFLHIAVPPPAYMRSYHGIAPHRSLVPCYLQGWAELAAEFGHWLAQRRSQSPFPETGSSAKPAGPERLP